MDEFSGCICQFLSTLIGGVRSAITNADSLSMPTDLGNVGAGPGGSVGAVPPAAAETNDGMAPAQVAALVVLLIVMVLTFLQNSTSSSTTTKGRNVSRPDDGNDDRSGGRPGRSVA
ncbi:putative transmembrane protein [Toxoplasma gondii TgCatPRC2]|uniref:Transmembrane protein n=15 Tax=Toxoplasma gondii TaxID=5811 RepID=A0A125YR55_TOXGG|nr:hypothetical protein TGME49_260620 [Toxoplasma gondii ME49]EPR62823.1 hypothetical protein TGGT1_260620 [Toxoplasma gondii GT1]ESS32075.1 putative transmembrane protein [Toxoplasma gondii VEG]KAF4641161.1 hypothetical protein TGRH88_069710 [Toxoplasma gondii]KFG39925.1 putative transmembrane protein [Toxoplasma gondii p89]KFG40327.1 putative transmembrane protein [Toxoplasma gondii FOU]KFG49173.1 putative transmembrane protein [Toxoplasma gondii GAB2-2007-GAL-DOM2]KFG65334.1 putative tran|eukprot:XP_002365235.1 hypothetical protein TGME49_260620 [Toxoplasma gondii ME49]